MDDLKQKVRELSRSHNGREADMDDAAIKVRPVGGGEEWATWNISQDLTDRWGGINDCDWENKPLDLLAEDSTLLARLREQMWNELTFIVRKDGKFGILFEIEFCSQESEKGENNVGDLKPHCEVVKSLLDGMRPLAEQFPGVEFAVPDEMEIFNERPAAWAFVADGLLTAAQREELGSALAGL